jgi:hypothetical protein
MKFFGNKMNTCNYFAEKYDTSTIFTNWVKTDTPGAKKGPSVWEFGMNPT